ncbi:hypothetical protein VJG86_12905, partial [Enterococcus faecium]|nr:hypothetical protein [Enterococcus faecium]
MKLEQVDFSISFITVYRAIYNGIFDTEPLSSGNRGLIRSLRHRGKTRHTKNHVEARGVCQYSCRIFIFHLSKSRTSLWSVG